MTFGKLPLALLISLLTLGSSLAQDVNEFHANSMTQMQAGQWAEAHGTLTEATEALDDSAMARFGPQFGWFWYHRGFAAMKIQQYEDAATSFQICYEKYPNQNVEAGKGNNVYHKLALLKWGDALKATEKFAEALDKYARFLAERDPTRDKFQPGVFNLNLAFCNFKLGNIEEGTKHFKTALDNKREFNTPDRGIMSTFATLVEAVIKAKDEAALLNFIAENRGVLELPPFLGHEFTPLLMKLAQDAKEAEMLKGTFQLYSLSPDTREVVADAKAYLKKLEGQPRPVKDQGVTLVPSEIETTLERAQRSASQGDVSEVYKFLNTATLHEEVGNVRGAYAVFHQLELYHPDAHIMKEGQLTPLREFNLYNLVRTSSLIAELDSTEKFGSRFLDMFPGSEYEPEVQRLMLTSLFWNGEYDDAIEVATSVLEKLGSDASDSEQHDIASFVLAGSKFYIGEFFEAAPLLDAYLERYTEEKTEEHRFQAALYFRASNLSRLQEWTRAGAELDAFLAKYPEAAGNPYLPFALYDRANVHYAQEEFDEALTALERVLNEFPGFPILDIVYNLKGNVQQSLDQRTEAEESYRSALEIAERTNNRPVVGESLFYLTALIGEVKKGVENERLPEAAAFYDRFWNEGYREDSPFKAKIAVAGIPALQDAERNEEALDRLQTVIAELSRTQGNPGLEEAINSYTEAYLEENTLDQLKEHYYNFPGIDPADSATRALLRIAVIGIVEEQQKKALAEDDTDRASANEALIKVLFQDLRREFDPKVLSNFILVRLGDFLRTKTSSPNESRAFYEEVLNREDISYRFPALFGLAEVLADGSESSKKQAVDYLQRVYQDSEDRSQREKALARLIDVQSSLGNHEQVIEKAGVYLGPDTNFRKNIIPVQFTLGESYLATGRTEEAMKMFGQVWSSNLGLVSFSAPAILAWSDIGWKRNQADSGSGVSDRQGAYDALALYHKQLSGSFEKMTPEDQALFQKVENRMNTYAANPAVEVPAAE